MTRTRVPTYELANQQGATALLAATFDFLRRNNIADKAIINYARQYCLRHKGSENLRLYRRLMRTYEDMGLLIVNRRAKLTTLRHPKLTRVEPWFSGDLGAFWSEFSIDGGRGAVCRVSGRSSGFF